MDSQTRRGYLKKAGLSSLGSVFVAFSGCVSSSLNSPASSYITGLKTVKSNDSLDNREFKRYVKKMNDRYGDQSVYGINQKIPTTTRNRFVGAWVSSKNTNNQAKTKNLDHAAILYRTKETNSSNQYYLWLWSAIQGNQNTGIFGDDQNLRMIEHKISLFNNQYLIDYSPKYKLKASDSPVNIGINGNNIRFPVEDGRIKINDNKTKRGEGGDFCAAWYGSYEGIQSMHSVVKIHDGRHDSEHYFSIGLKYRTSQWGI